MRRPRFRPHLILLCFLLLSLAAVWSWIAGDAYASAGNFFASFYTLAFGSLLVAFEVKVGRIDSIVRRFFGFMYKAHFRTAYIVFIGTIPLGLGKCGMTLGILMICNAIFNGYVLMKYPMMLKPSEAAGTQAFNPGDSSPHAGLPPSQ